MKKNLKNLFAPEVQDILTEDTLDAIESAFNEKVKLSVDAALLEQDEIYAEKLQQLINVIDKDKTKKLKTLVKVIDEKHSSQLVKLVRLYERANKTDAKKFKTQVVNSISAYLDEFLTESIDQKDLATAVKNKTAYKVLENMRKVLAVDSVLMKESVQEAVVDGNTKILKLEAENKELKKQFKALYEANQRTEVAMLLESKTSKLSEAKKNFLKKALGDKSPQFIEENFDYTLRLFEKQEKSKLETLKEDALNKRQVKPDVVPQQKIVKEQLNTNDSTDMYLEALKRSKGTR